MSASDKLTNFESVEAVVWWQWRVEFTPQLLHHDNDVMEVVFVTTQYHIVQISQSENQNLYSESESWINIILITPESWKLRKL